MPLVSQSDVKVVLAVWWLCSQHTASQTWLSASPQALCIATYLFERVLELFQLREAGGVQQQRHLHIWSNARGIRGRQLLQK